MGSGGKSGGGSSAPQFSTQQKQDYLAANPDVAADPYYGSHPEDHWKDYGQYEPNRKTAPEVETSAPSVYDGFSSYMSAYEEQQKRYQEALQQQQQQYQQQLAEQEAQRKAAEEAAAAAEKERLMGLATEAVDSELKYNETQAKLRGLKYTAPEDSEYQTMIDAKYKSLSGASSEGDAATADSTGTTKKTSKKKVVAEEEDDDEELGGTVLLGG